MTVLFALPVRLVAIAHTGLAGLAFSLAIFAGWASGLWQELCINSVARWPTEWWPSVSATVGDHAASRAPFHILIALCATPRFLLLLAQWIVHRYQLRGSSIIDGRTLGEAKPADGQAVEVQKVRRSTEQKAEKEVRGKSGGTLADVELGVGLARTFCCGGWMYITSRDHHDLHDFFMIVYLLLNLPWMILSAEISPSSKVRSRRRLLMAGFLAMVPGIVWQYYRHSVLRIPGAYTTYAFFEWGLVIWDIAFDAVAISELSHIRFAVIDVSVEPGSPTKIAPDGVYLPALPPAPASVPIDDWIDRGKTMPSPPWRAAVAWASDVYFGVCFWTVFTALGFQLFYWSVWKLALSGSELALLANLSPFFMRFNSIRNLATSRRGQLYLRAATIGLGMGCYFIPIVAVRLLCVSLGTSAGWLVVVGNFARLQGGPQAKSEAQSRCLDPQSMSRLLSVLGLGIVITMLIKYINYSTNPFWCLVDWKSGGWNLTGLLLGLVSLLEHYTRPLDLFPEPPTETKPAQTRIIHQSQQYLLAIGLGAFIHLLQTFLSDAGTIIAWSWTGFPITGPTLHPFAACTIAAALLGVIVPIPGVFGFGILGGAYGLCTCTDWIGFGSGLQLTMFLSALLPAFAQAASACDPVAVWGTALAVNCLLDVASVVTAAYAFVPYGWVLRERTDLVLGFCTVATIVGALVASKIRPPVSVHGERSILRNERIKIWTMRAGLVLGAVAAVFSYSKIPTTTPTPYFPEYKMFTGGIWTVHFGVDEAGRDSQWRMMELIRDMQVDVVGLLETDLHRFVYGNRDLTRVISEELGYYVDLGPGPNHHTWGAALLSKFPILNSTHHLLPSPHGELAPAIHATLDIHGTEVDVFVSHNGQEEDALDRQLQTEEIARLLRAREHVPTVFLGYLVTKPGDQRPKPYQILMEDGKMWDIEATDKWRWCEYIAFRGLWRVGYARLDEGSISDTELQVGKFLLPLPGQVVEYKDNTELYWHIGEYDVPEPWRFPRQFWNEGVRGHRYRVWIGPVYYLPPESSGMREYGRGWDPTLPVVAP